MEYDPLTNPEMDEQDLLLKELSENGVLKEDVRQRKAEEEVFAKELREARQDQTSDQLPSITASQQAGAEPLPQATTTAPTQPEDEEPQVGMWKELEAAKGNAEAEDAWYIKYHGKTKDEYFETMAAIHGGPVQTFTRVGDIVGKTAAAAGLGVIDIVPDIVGLVGGEKGREFNDWFDRQTRFENPAYRAVRQIFGVVAPVAGGTKAALTAFKVARMPRVAKALAAFGIDLGVDAAFIGVSDQGKDDNLFRTLDDIFPWLNFSDNIKTLDDDSTEVRRIKNLYASGPMAIVGNILGTSLALGNKVKPFSWFKPKDEQAAAVKKALQETNNDPETIIRIAEIDEALTSKTTTQKETTLLKAERKKLKEQLETTGYSDVTTEPLESSVSRKLDLEEEEITEAAIRKVEEDPFSQSYDPVVTPSLAKEGTTGRPGIEPGATLRNAGDVSAIKNGVSKGDPAPIVSENMLTKFLKAGGSSRKAVVGMFESFRDAGDFDAKVAGFRFTKAQMDDDAFELYADIVNTPDVDELKKLFSTRRRDIKQIKDGEISYITDVDYQAAGFAMRDLIDEYLGRGIAAQSGRTMTTLGAEVRTLSESANVFDGIVDENIVMEKVIDKIAFLTEEVAISKYVAGWQLNNKGFFQRFAKSDNPDNLAKLTLKEFTVARNKAHKKAMEFRQNLLRVKDENPQLLRPLMDSYVLSNGNVDTIDKLNTWAFDQINPANYLYNKKGQNLFSKSLTSIVLNNMLSGLSAARTGIANTVALVQKPINALLSHGIASAFSSDADELKRFAYVYGAWAETNRRATVAAWKTLKAVNADPTANIDLIRKDLRLYEDKTWEAVDDVAENIWKKEDFGKATMYNWAKLQKNVAQWPLMRWGTTAMAAEDSYVGSTLASQVARIRAYDDVLKSGKEVTPKALQEAEKAAYAKMFDENGRLTDWAASNMTGEVALNLDDDVAGVISRAIDKIPALRHFVAFPRTGINSLKVAGSYVGTSAIPIPGLSKYNKVLYARTQEEIADALADHGLKNFDTDPNAMAIFKHLKREYQGRLAFSAGLVASLWGWAMAGNIRGNGAVNAGDRRNQRDSLGFRTKEIKIGDKWVSFTGFDGIEPTLTILGDLAYHARDISPEKSEQLRARLAWTLTATFLDKTFMSGLEPFFSILDGNETAFNKAAANTMRSYIPMSGALGAIANGISSSQKDIHNDLIGYVQNRLPGVNTLLPEQIDFWTGKPLNDIDNPFLRILNAGSPIKFSDDQEPWRKWLYETGWDGMSRMRKDSSGNHEYTPEQRELIYRYMAEDNLDEVMASNKFMGNAFFNEIIGKLRALKQRAKYPLDKEGNPIEFNVELTPVHNAINKVLRESKKRAEQRLLKENPQIAESIFAQQRVDKFMQGGQIEEAARAAEEQKTQLKGSEQIKQFSQYGSN